MNATKTVRIRLGHRSSIPMAWWCEPIDWEPSNEIEGAEWCDTGWWDAEENVAGIVVFGDFSNDGREVFDVDLDELRVVSCGNCRILEDVEL